MEKNGLKNGKNQSDDQAFEDIEDYLHKIYYTTTSLVSYSNPEALYHYVKKNYPKKISRGIIKKWLSKQEAYTLHRAERRKFKRPRVLAFYKNYQWDTDTANIVKYKKYNDQFAYFAVFIDIFTRYLYTRPMKTLSGKEMVEVMRNILNETTENPDIIRSDQGSEYRNRELKHFLSERNIKHVFTYYETKANYAERVIKTIKSKIVKYLTAKETYRWIDELENITFSYNNSIHRSIGRSPKEATNSDHYELWQFQYGEKLKDKKKEKKEIKSKKPKPSYLKYKFKIGDHVKINFFKSKFDREYSERWSREIFSIIDRKYNQNVPMYQIKDYNNEIIKSFFYQPELQKAYIDADVVYKIDKILKKRKRSGVQELLVKWKGWPDKFNSWIPETNLEDIS